MGYKFKTIEGSTTITPTHVDPGLPQVECHVVPCGEYCVCTVYIDGNIVITADVQRGKSFAAQIGRFLVKGVLSRVGRQRRMAANQAARKAVSETESRKEVA